MKFISSLILWLISTIFSPQLSPTLTATSPLSQIQETFSSAIHVTTTGQDNRSMYITVTNESQLANPTFYHQVFPLCQQLYSQAIDVIIFYSPEKSELRRTNCNQGVNKYTTTGSISYALWQVSYSSSTEENLVDAMYSASTYQSSIELGEQLVASYPSAPNIYDLGFWHYMRSSELRGTAESETHYQLAKKYYKQAIDLDPDFAPAHASYAYTLMDSEGITSEVTHHFDQAKELDPGWSFAWMNQGMSYAYHGQATRGYELLKEAVTKNPKFPDQSRVIQNFLCLGRQLKKTESDDFYSTYDIDTSQHISFCPY